MVWFLFGIWFNVKQVAVGAPVVQKHSNNFDKHLNTSVLKLLFRSSKIAHVQAAL